MALNHCPVGNQKFHINLITYFVGLWERREGGGLERFLTKIGIGTIGIGEGSVAIAGRKAKPGKGIRDGMRNIGTGVQKGIGISLGLSISRPLANVVVGRQSSALGHGIQALGDGVKTSAGAEGNAISGSEAIGVGTISTISIGIQEGVSISRPLTNVVNSRKSALGHGVQSLGDGVKTSARAEGNAISSSEAIGVGTISTISIGIQEGVSISRPLTNVVNSRQSALGHGVQSLGDRVKTGAGA